MDAELYVARRQLRRKAASLAVLTVLIAVVAGAVMSCATAARRSQSALDRLRSSAQLSDVTFELGDPRLADRITGLALVERAAVLEVTAMFPVDAPDGFFPVLADRSGTWLRSFDRVDVLEGALPSIDDPEAVILTEAVAGLLDVQVGDRLPMMSLSADEMARLESEEFEPSFDGPRLTLTVAAVVRPPPTNDDPNEDVLSLLTPAFLERHGAEISTFGALVAVRLVPGATLAQLAAAIAELPGGDAVYRDAVGTGGMDATRSALSTVAFGLTALAAAAALVGLVIAAQGVSRLVLSASDDAPVLAAMGMRPRVVVAVLTATAVVPILVGVTAGAMIAPWLAPLLVGDLARRLDPDPGMVVDWTVLIAGVVIAFGVLASSAVVTATLHQRRPGRGASARRAGLAAIAARAGLANPIVAGLSMAFARSGRRVPTRQALVVASVGVMGLVGVTVFGASLDRALEQPHQYGWGWDASLRNDLAEDPAELDRRGVTDAALISYGVPVRLDGEPVPGMAMEPMRGRIDPVLVRGDLPRGLDEVLVGEKTLDDLRAGIGDRVELRGPDGSLDVTIVGTTVLAAPDDPLPLARGVVIDPGLFDELGLTGEDGTATEVTYTQLAVVVHGDAREAFGDLAEGDEVTYPSPPVEVSRLNDVRSFPVVFAGFLALLAAVGVGHAMSVVVRRRRLDFGLLRALGFTRRQARHAVLAQGATIIAVALIVGMPVGVVGGRLGWRLVTTSIGLPFRPVVSIGWLSAIGVSAVFAVLAATAPSVWASGRIRLSDTLRAE